MIVKLCGAILLVAASSCIGFGMIHRSTEKIELLRQLSQFLARIAYSLQYHQYPLPQLLRNQEGVLNGELLMIIRRFVEELESQVAPNAGCCMDAAIAGRCISEDVKYVLHMLSNSFGEFDLHSQLKCLEGAGIFCKEKLELLEGELPGYIRCCKAYSLCVGILIVLFFI